MTSTCPNPADNDSTDHAEMFAAQVEKELNTISWTQIPVTDLTRARKFYNTIFKWEFDDLSMEQCTQDAVKESAEKDLSLTPQDPMFSMFRFPNDPIPHGGLVRVTPENLLSPALHASNEKKARLSVCATITVRSIDETLERIVAAGGEVYSEKVLIPSGMGANALFLDTEKNVMGLWSEK